MQLTDDYEMGLRSVTQRLNDRTCRGRGDRAAPVRLRESLAERRRRAAGFVGLAPAKRAQREQRQRVDAGQSEPKRRAVRRAAAERARVCVAVAAQRQQHDLDVDRRKAGRRGVGAEQERLRFVGERGEDRRDVGAVGLAPQAQERPAAASRRGIARW